MTDFSEMSYEELAAFVSDHLRKNGVENVLTGGGCVTIYSENRWISSDLDFVNIDGVSIKKITDVLAQIGFEEENRYYKNKDLDITIDIISPPLSVGEESISNIDTLKIKDKELKLLKPIDSLKDRLASYYHWNDQQCLEQAVFIREKYDIDLNEIKRWSRNEGMLEKYALFLQYDINDFEPSTGMEF